MIFFSHLIIEDENFKSLNGLKNIGYKIKFRDRLRVEQEKLNILYGKPNIVDLIYLHHQYLIDIELVNHNKNILIDNDVFNLGINTRISKNKFLYSNFFSECGDILLSTTKFDDLVNFYIKNFHLKKIKISKKELIYFKENFNSLNCSKLKFIDNFPTLKKPNIYIYEVKKEYVDQKYLNNEGISCISFLDLHNSLEKNFRKHRFNLIGPMNINIKLSSLKKFYFLRDIDNNIIEIVN